MGESEVRDEPLVEDRVDRLAVVARAGGLATNSLCAEKGRRALPARYGRFGPLNRAKQMPESRANGSAPRSDGRPRTVAARAREHALREAVRGGRLAPGTRLPSTRTLCAELGVSRGVVVDAYAQLAAEGYLHTRRGAGTTVAATARTERPRGPAPRRYRRSATT